METEENGRPPDPTTVGFSQRRRRSSFRFSSAFLRRVGSILRRKQDKAAEYHQDDIGGGDVRLGEKVSKAENEPSARQDSYTFDNGVSRNDGVAGTEVEGPAVGSTRDMDSEVSSSTGTPFRARRPGPLDTSTIGTSTPSHMSQSEAKTPTTSTTAPLTPVDKSGRDGADKTGSIAGGIRPAEKEKIGHRRIDDEGKVTFKKIHSSTIIESIQLGIGYAVGSLASKPERDLLMQDFAMVDNLDFPREGGTASPAHHHDSFKFKAYSPVAFRYFRDLFQIQPGDFLLSLCNEPMRELSNPGASGSLFYVTADDEFIIKTVAHVEADFLQNLLPGYYMNLHQNPRTLLPKFFGLFCYIASNKNVRVIVMNNLLPSSVRMHLKYDLKGSTHKRKANKAERQKKSPTFKDLDFMEHHPEGILLDAQTYDALINTIQRDCRVLESFKIMDYSLLLGIHNIDQAAREAEAADTAVDGASLGASTGGANIPRSKSMNRGRLAAFSTAIESIDHDENSPPGGIPAVNSKGERLLLFIGIIDILQSYRLRKKLEHSWKALLHDGDTVSVHKPGFYAKRFQDFMSQRVFKRMATPLKHTPSKKNPKLVTVVRRVMQEKHDVHPTSNDGNLLAQQQKGSMAPPSTPVPPASSNGDESAAANNDEQIGEDLINSEVTHDALTATSTTATTTTSNTVATSSTTEREHLEEMNTIVDGLNSIRLQEVVTESSENTNGGTHTSVSSTRVIVTNTAVSSTSKETTKM